VTCDSFDANTTIFSSAAGCEHSSAAFQPSAEMI